MTDNRALIINSLKKRKLTSGNKESLKNMKLHTIIFNYILRIILIGLMKIIEIRINKLNLTVKESTAQEFTDKVFCTVEIKDFDLNVKYSKKEKFIVGINIQALEIKLRPNSIDETKHCRILTTCVNAVMKIPASHNLKLSAISSTIHIKTDFIFMLINDAGIKELVFFINKTMLIKGIKKYFKFDIFPDEHTRRFSTNLLEPDSMAQVK